MLCGFAFEAGAAGRAIDDDQADALLSSQPPAGAHTFLWLHFNLANQASERWLRQRLALPDAFYESFEHSTSTRVEVAEDSLVPSSTT